MDLRGHLDLVLLATLRATGPVHGYGLITALSTGSEGTFDLPEGTVYPALHRLERDGLVTSTWSEGSGRARRVYALTKQGREAITSKASAWRQLSAGVDRVLHQTPHRGRPA
jgi:PadR family transcriptional regulator, regulatory protein PadR